MVNEGVGNVNIVSDVLLLETGEYDVNIRLEMVNANKAVKYLQLKT